MIRTFIVFSFREKNVVYLQPPVDATRYGDTLQRNNWFSELRQPRRVSPRNGVERFPSREVAWRDWGDEYLKCALGVDSCWTNYFGLSPMPFRQWRRAPSRCRSRLGGLLNYYQGKQTRGSCRTARTLRARRLDSFGLDASRPWTLHEFSSTMTAKPLTRAIEPARVTR